MMSSNNGPFVSGSDIQLDSTSLPVTKKTTGKLGVTMSFHDIVYKVDYKLSDMPCSKTAKKTILNGISGVMEPGLTAIMGPTGSGKTSLLDVLAGRKDPAGIKGGQVLMNGKTVKGQSVRLSTGYVVQDDMVVGTLSVRENLMFSANCRLPNSKFSLNERSAMVDKVIDDLGLNSCADTKVGNEMIRGVSGGERKRVSIGMELLIDPPVLFLDEPTTGLDAYTAGTIVKLLSDLGHKGRTIILSIHQPRYSIFELFDHLIILSRGDVVYNGPRAQSVEYFSSIGYSCPQFHNPGDFLLDVVNGQILKNVVVEYENGEVVNHEGKVALAIEDVEADTIEEKKIKAATELSRLFRESETAEKERLKLKHIEAMQTTNKDIEFEQQISDYPNGFSQQMQYVMNRTFLDFVRNPVSFFGAVGSSVFISLCIGIVFFQLPLNINGIQDRAGSIYFLVVVNVMNNMQALEIFIAKRAQFRHEKAGGYYRTSVYFLSRVFADILPQRWFPMIFFSIITYFMMGFQMDAGKFFFFFLNLCLITTAGATLAFAISSSFNMYATAAMGMMVPMLFMMLFGGFLVNTDSVLYWLEWVKWLSVFRYGLNGLLVNEMKELVFINNSSFPGFDPNSATPCFSNVTMTNIPECKTGIEYLDSQNMPYDTWGLWQNIVALACISIAYCVLAYLQLRRVSIYK